MKLPCRLGKWYLMNAVRTGAKGCQSLRFSSGSICYMTKPKLSSCVLPVEHLPLPWPSVPVSWQRVLFLPFVCLFLSQLLLFLQFISSFATLLRIRGFCIPVGLLILLLLAHAAPTVSADTAVGTWVCVCWHWLTQVLTRFLGKRMGRPNTLVFFWVCVVQQQSMANADKIFMKLVYQIHWPLVGIQGKQRQWFPSTFSAVSAGIAILVSWEQTWQKVLTATSALLDSIRCKCGCGLEKYKTNFGSSFSSDLWKYVVKTALEK